MTRIFYVKTIKADNAKKKLLYYLTVTIKFFNFWKLALSNVFYYTTN